MPALIVLSVALIGIGTNTPVLKNLKLPVLAKEEGDHSKNNMIKPRTKKVATEIILEDKKMNVSKSAKGVPADGDFVGEGCCAKFQYVIRLIVSFEDGKAVAIKDMKLIDNDDPSNIPYCKKAWKPMVKSILKSQNSDVDAVSQATYSSNAIKEAYNDALKKAIAKNDGKTLKKNKKSRAVHKDNKPIINGKTIPEGKIYDGNYRVSVTCEPDSNKEFEPYELTATFTFKNERLIQISDIDSNDKSNKKYYNWALNGRGDQKGILGQLLVNQNSDGLSAVSGATCSSIAFRDMYIKAVKMAQGQKDDKNEASKEAPNNVSKENNSKSEEVVITNPFVKEPILNQDIRHKEFSSMVYCIEDEYGEYDFDDYKLFVDISYYKGMLLGIKILDCGDDKNLKYCQLAINGDDKTKGLLEQFVTTNSYNVDSVSGATCTSEALKKIFKEIKEKGLD